MKTFFAALVFGFVSIVPAHGQTADLTTWTNKKGETVLGKQVGIDLTKQTMQLETGDNKIYTLSLADLSKDDSDRARVWKFPPKISLDLTQKQISIQAGIAGFQTSGVGASIKITAITKYDYEAQISVKLSNLSKSGHDFLITYILLGDSDNPTDPSFPRPVTYLKQIKITLDPLKTSDDMKKTAPLHDDSTPYGGAETLNPDDPFGLIQIFSDKTKTDSFAILVSCADDATYFQAKGFSLILEQYTLANAKTILAGYPKPRTLTTRRGGKGGGVNN